MFCSLLSLALIMKAQGCDLFIFSDAARLIVFSLDLQVES